MSKINNLQIVCTLCGISKSVTEFYKHKQMTSGRINQCKPCKKEAHSRWKEANQDKMQAYRNKWKEINLEKNTKSKKDYKINNRAKYLKQKSEYAKKHRAGYNAQTAKYRAQKLKATPVLSDFEEFVIQEIYSLCDLRSKLTKIKHHVDHFYPLVSNMVCGLHNSANLRIITGVHNQSKGNRLIGEEI